MENERVARRDIYLNGEKLEQLKAATIAAFESTIQVWLQNVDAALSFQYEWTK